MSLVDVNYNLLSFLFVLFMYLHKRLEISNNLLTGLIVVLKPDLNNSAFDFFLFYRIF